MEIPSSSASVMDLASNWDWGEAETDVAFECTTPTSNLSSPRFQKGCRFELGSPIENFVCSTPTGSSPPNSPRFDDPSMDQEVPFVSCLTQQMLPYLGGCQYAQTRLPDMSTESRYACSCEMQLGNMKWVGDCSNNPEPEKEPDTEYHSEAPDARTRLKVQARAFQPVPKDTRMEAVISTIHLALFSSGQVNNINIESGAIWMNATVISAQVLAGPDAPARAYNVMHLTKNALEAITARLPTVALLSARVQKEDQCCYSLRSSIACLPEHAQNCMCWDLFRNGHCPRRSQCRWYHPQKDDIARIRVFIRCAEDVHGTPEEKQLKDEPSDERHKLSLGDLVH